MGVSNEVGGFRWLWWCKGDPGEFSQVPSTCGMSRVVVGVLRWRHMGGKDKERNRNQGKVRDKVERECEGLSYKLRVSPRLS